MRRIIALGLLIPLILACSQLPQAQPPQEIVVGNGGTLQLYAAEVEKTIAGKEQRMYAYNGQIPGPRIRVTQGSGIKVNFTNSLDEPTTVHWHGLRHDVKDDGVPIISQKEVQPGESFLYNLDFPDEGIFWYHPHVREDRQQELGLSGNIIVEPTDNHYSQVEHEEFLVLDDIFLENGKIVGFGAEHANFALMGRYGNIHLVNGEEKYSLDVAQGDAVRFYITAVSNVRPFNLSIEGATLKLVGGDIGRYEREELIDSVIIGPAERYVVEATFNEPGAFRIRNVNMWDSYDLGEIRVKQSGKRSESALRRYKDVEADIAQYREHFDRRVDETLRLSVELEHAEEMRSLTNIEWEDTMVEENRHSTPEDVRWILRDEQTGAENMDISYRFLVGDVKRIRVINDAESAHPMQHLIHIHGQRFLILEQDGIRNTNMVWKDTFLIPTGSYVDIILDASNPGTWMTHCHIAEHLEADMMMTMTVV
jgi:FtsP/CotA-like multicopper oxidase with cupredoxin domain